MDAPGPDGSDYVMEKKPIQPDIHGTGEPTASQETEERLKEAFSFWASGVAVVTVTSTPLLGITVTAFCPVSLRPPMLLVCINRDAPVLPVLLEQRRFTVNVLAADQRALASAFADRLPVGRIPLREPDCVLLNSLVSFVCSLATTVPAGDHHILTGNIMRMEFGEERAPLIRYRRSYLLGDRPNL
jgi:flavin reductase (NADH)